MTDEYEDALMEVEKMDREMKSLLQEKSRIKQEYEDQEREISKAWVEIYDSPRRKELKSTIRRLDPKGPRCSKCGGYTSEPGYMISDDSYSQFQCPFHSK